MLLRLYLEVTYFTSLADHEALQYILTMTEATGNLARWRFKQSELDFDTSTARV